MLKKIFYIGMIIAAVLSTGTVRSFAYFAEDEIDVYQNSEFLLMEVDRAQNLFYALVKKENYYTYVQFNGYYDEVFSITNLFNLEGMDQAVSSIDLTSRRYFFTTTSGNQSFLYVLGLDSGEVLNMFPLDFLVSAMKYDEATASLIALGRNKHGNTKTVRIDTDTGDLTKLADLSRTYSLDYRTAFMNEKKQEIWVTADQKSDYVITVSTRSGKAGAVRVLNVRPDETVVYNFNTMRFNQTLFSSGTKDSLYFMGMNDQFKTVFILHMSAEAKNVKEKIEELQKQLLEYSPGGIADYTLKVVCPKSFENFTAFSKAVSLEKNVKEIYGVAEIDHKEFFIGRPPNIVVSAEGISVY